MSVKLVVGKLLDLRSEVRAKLEQPHALADLNVELASYKCELGDYLGKYKLDYETERGRLYQKYIAQEGNNSKAENLTRTELSEHRGKIEQLTIMHKDLDKLISTIQTKLRNLETSAKNQY